MPITSKQSNYPVIYHLFDATDTVRLVAFKEDTLHFGDIDQVHRGQFKLRLLLDKGIFLRAIIYDDDVVHNASDDIVVHNGQVTINGQPVNMYYGG